MSVSAFHINGLLHLSSLTGGSPASPAQVMMLLPAAASLLRSGDVLPTALFSRRSLLAASLNLAPSSAANLGIASIEVISTGFRSLSLGFRFSANASAGHVIADVLFYSTSAIYKVSGISLLLPGLLVYEVGVAIIQTGIFSLLFTSYVEV